MKTPNSTKSRAAQCIPESYVALLMRMCIALVDALQPTSEEFVCAWYQRITGLPAVGSKEGDAFLGKLVEKAAKERIRISARCIDQIVAVDRKVSALTAQASLCERSEKGDLLQRAAAEARKAQNPFEATAASITVAQAYLDFSPAEASAVLRWGAHHLLKHETAFGLASDAAAFSEACELMPASIVGDVGPVLRDAVLNYPYGADYRKRGDEKARALVQIVCLFWRTDVACARRTLVEACKAYTEALPLDYIGYWCGELCGVAKRICAAHGRAAGKSFIEALFQSLEPQERGAVGDGMMLTACEFTGFGKMPLEDFGILCPAVDEKREWLMNVLLPLCSERMQAKAHIVGAANRWNTKLADCKEAVTSALQIAQRGTCKLDDKDWESLWILDVISHGTTRVCEAASQLLAGELPQNPFRIKGRSTKLAERVTLLIQAAYFAAENKSRLLRQLWQAFQGLNRY
jgi:hypothetical protein